jgi:murein endopeptidase
MLRSSAAVAAVAALLVAASPASACESRAIGKPWDGRLTCGVQLPADTESFVTWDSPLQATPDRAWRRWGTQKLVDTVEAIATDYHARYGVRLVIGDLSRPKGGPFGRKYGGVGHASHQNGLDVDIYYPRRDRLELPPRRPREVDTRRAQWLVNRAAEDAQYVFIGPHVGLRRTRKYVQYLPQYHDNHLHLRIYP